jgi:hypothetical protein
MEKTNIDHQLKVIDGDLDIETLTERFKLKENGGRDGKDNLPKPESSSLSPTELSVIAHLNKLSGNAFGIYSKNIANLMQERTNLKNELNLEEDIQAILHFEQQYKPQISYLIEDGKSKIKDAAIEYGDGVRNFKNFQLQNDLTTRSPIYPTSSLEHLKWILLGGLIELIIAAIYYTDAAANPLAGMAFALLIVVGNVLIAYMAGERLRFINHKNYYLKISYTLLSVVVYIIFLAAIIYGAQLRQALADLLEVNPDLAENILNIISTAGKKAGELVIVSPFAFFNNAVTSLIFFVSLGFGILVSYKGYKSDDEYPGYGEADREKNKKQAILENTQTAFFEKLSQLHKKNIEVLKNKIDQIKGNCEQIIASIEDHKFILRHAEQKFASIENTMNGCLAMYRAANEFVRTLPTPAYFKINQTLAEYSHQKLIFISDEDIQIENNLKIHIQRVTEQFNLVNSTLSTLEHETVTTAQLQINEIRINAVEGSRQ